MNSSRNSPGVTVTEVLVALSLLSLLGVVFVSLFSQARSSAEGGAERVELRALHREAQVRIAQLLRSCIAPNEVDPAIVVPEFEETEVFCRFRAPSNLLDSTVAFVPRTPNYPEFTMSLRPGQGSVQTQLSDGTGPLVSFGRGFTTLEFERDGKRTLTVKLTSVKTIRGASNAPKEVREVSENKVMLPGVP